LVNKIQNDKQKALRELSLKKKHVKRKDFVTGDDLIKLGMKPGNNFKVILEKVTDLQIDGKITDKQEGIDYVKKHYL